METSQLYYGDNLDILRKYIKDESIDLIYLDPPFNSKANYNILFKESSGESSKSQIEAFTDFWHWDSESAKTFDNLVTSAAPVNVIKATDALVNLLGHNDMSAYIVMMTVRLLELKRVLKKTGSIYLHCDSTASHYLKIMMDQIFGPTNFVNEIIWRRTGSNNSADGFGPIHQTILFYAKDKNEMKFYYTKGPYTIDYVKKFFIEEDERGIFRSVLLTGPGTRKGDSGKPWKGYNPTSSGRHWQPASYLYEKYKELTNDDLSKYPLLERLEKLDGIGLIHWGKNAKVPTYKLYLKDASGVPYQDIWAFQPGTQGCIYNNPNIGIDQDVKWLTGEDKEKLGYPTQKPLGLLERILRASSKEGDIVLDPFCGCGTTIDASEKLGRKWVGIDITHLAINLIKRRIKDKYPNAKFDIIGEPKDLEGAKQLATSDRYQFQWWALSLIDAIPANDKKKGADTGIDGEIFYRTADKTIRVLVQVKSGEVQVKDIRDFAYVCSKANYGIFITLEDPTGPMEKVAIEQGYTKETVSNEQVPKLEIITIKELLEQSKVPKVQQVYNKVNVSYKKAQHKKERKVKELKKGRNKKL